MGTFVVIIVVLAGCVGLLGVISLWGRLSQSWALVILFNLFQIATVGGLGLYDDFSRVTGGPMNSDSHMAGGIATVWVVFSMLVALALRLAALRFAALLHSAGMRPSIPPERPIAQLVKSLGGQSHEQIVQQVQKEYVAPTQLVEGLIGRSRRKGTA
ncbi:MAG TPA: hypothetical protein VFS21_16810 [Roseiflexaceae bacterium]|nr:hypothetical protein [Roseiflexaceae bacterium]